MRILIIVAVIIAMVVTVAYVTRHAWSEELQEYIAQTASDAIHSSGPSEPSFIKGFAGGVAKKLIKLELNRI
jgi:hypothetical protein